MSRTAVPTVLKESLMKDESVRRIYRRGDDNKSWVPIGWVILDSDLSPLYTVTDIQCCEFENIYELLFTQSKTTGDES